MNKNIIISLLIVVVFLAVGYILAGKNTLKNQPVEEGNNVQVQGKIDINAVCEGALAYMTFPDGASAEAFVAECKEGKHPQVIEDYIKQMNLGDEAAL